MQLRHFLCALSATVLLGNLSFAADAAPSLATIEKAARDPSAKVRATLGGSPFTPERILLQLAQEKNWDINKELAGNGFASAAVLDYVADQVPKLRGNDIPHADARINDTIDALLSNLHSNPETLRKLHGKGIAYFHFANAWHNSPNWPADMLIDFALQYAFDTSDTPVEKKFWNKINQERAMKPPHEVLAMMLRGPIYYLRNAAVSSRFTPPQALEDYYRSGQARKDDSLEELARNPATSKALALEMIAKSKGSDLNSVMYSMQKRVDLDPDLLRAMVVRGKQHKPLDGDLALHVRDAAQLLEVQNTRASLQ
jgi:hypothetical protein